MSKPKQPSFQFNPLTEQEKEMFRRLGNLVDRYVEQRMREHYQAIEDQLRMYGGFPINWEQM